MKVKSLSPVVPISAEFPVRFNLKKQKELLEISGILGISTDSIIDEALDDWMSCILPVRLQAILVSQNEKRRRV